MSEFTIDISGLLREQVLKTIANKTSLNIIGSNTKAFYGRPAKGEPLWVAGHEGIVSYDPSELIISARCGTRLAEIEMVLAKCGQMLPFEPPYFGQDATLGGTVATGLSGPRRPYAGSVQDGVLGVKILNGQGEILKFGGAVMKNVAGFDVSRLMVGSLGTLGVVLEVTMKVLPMPEMETTLAFTINLSETLIWMNQWQMQNLPLSAMSHDGETLWVRLSGAETAISSVIKKLGGELMPTAESTAFWADLREHRLAFFQSDETLWRLSVGSAAKQPDLSGNWFLDWGGSLRWLKTDEAAETIFHKTQELGGHACRFRSPLGGEFQPLASNLEQLHRRVKQAFDPLGIFNPGRLYAGW